MPEHRRQIRMKRIWNETIRIGLVPDATCVRRGSGSDINLRVQAYVPTLKSGLRGLSIVSLAWHHRIDFEEHSDFRKAFAGGLNRISCGLSTSDVVWLTNSSGFPDGREQLCRWLIMNIPQIVSDLRVPLRAQRKLVLTARLSKTIEGLKVCPFCMEEIDEAHVGASSLGEMALTAQCEWIASRGNPKQCDCDPCAEERRSLMEPSA